MDNISAWYAARQRNHRPRVGKLFLVVTLVFSGCSGRTTFVTPDDQNALASFFYAGNDSTLTGKKEKQGECQPDKPVHVVGHIWGGAAGNKIKFEAKCGNDVVASCEELDPGGGGLNQCTNQGKQKRGAASCKWTYTASGDPASDWFGVCVFLN